MSFSIKKLNDDVFEVTIADTINTAHMVKVTDQRHSDLTKNDIAKTQLVEVTFKFLLDREPNTSIIQSFDITVIEHYFPEYRDEVRRWCSGS